MSGAGLACIAVTALGVAGLLRAEAQGDRRAIWLTKPLASTGFVALALVLGAAATPYGRLVLAALVASWLGDVLLIARGARTGFVLGLLAFLTGHLLYVGAFASLGLAAGPALVAAALVAVAAAGALRWLWPHVEGGLRVAVGAYVLVISAMVVAACGAGAATGRLALPVGALLFYVSDLAVARHRFVVASPANKFWGLPTYYAGQLFLAATVA